MILCKYLLCNSGIQNQIILPFCYMRLVMLQEDILPETNVINPHPFNVMLCFSSSQPVVQEENSIVGRYGEIISLKQLTDNRDIGVPSKVSFLHHLEKNLGTRVILALGTYTYSIIDTKCLMIFVSVNLDHLLKSTRRYD